MREQPEATLTPLSDDEEGYEVRWSFGGSFVAYVYLDAADKWRPYDYHGQCLNPGRPGFRTPIQAAYWETTGATHYGPALKKAVGLKKDRRCKATCRICGGKIGRPSTKYAWSHVVFGLDSQHAAAPFDRPALDAAGEQAKQVER
jgi:hypothetical protein